MNEKPLDSDGDDTIRLSIAEARELAENALLSLGLTSLEAARVADAAGPRGPLRPRALARAQREPVVASADPGVQVEGRAAQPAARVDDPGRGKPRQRGQQPLVDDVMRRDVRPVRCEPPVDRERRVAAATDEPGELLEAPEPVVVASDPAQRPRLSRPRSID